MVKDRRVWLEGKATLLAQATAAVAQERGALKVAKAALEDSRCAQTIIQKAAAAVQQATHSRVSAVVTRCLRAVWGEEGAYAFQLQFDRKRGRTEARPLFLRGGQEFGVDEVEGGVVDVTSFALRLACVMCMRPRPRLFLALDEPFKHVSAENTPPVRFLLEALAKELGLRLFIVTHNQALRAGEVIEL